MIDDVFYVFIIYRYRYLTYRVLQKQMSWDVTRKILWSIQQILENSPKYFEF